MLFSYILPSKSAYLWTTFSLLCLFFTYQYFIHIPVFDEAEHLIMTRFTSQGFRPYIDFFEHHAPLTWIILAPFISLNPAGNLVIPIYKTALVLVYSTLITAICKKLNPPNATSSKTRNLTYIFIYSLFVGVGLFWRFNQDNLAIILLLFGITHQLRSPPRLHSYLAGFFYGLAILSSLKAIAALPLILIIFSPPNTSIKQKIKSSALTLALALIIPSLFFLLLANLNLTNLALIRQSLIRFNQLTQNLTFFRINPLEFLSQLAIISPLIIPILFVLKHRRVQLAIFYTTALLTYLHLTHNLPVNTVRLLIILLVWLPAEIHSTKFSHFRQALAFLSITVMFATATLLHSFQSLYLPIRSSATTLALQNPKFILTHDNFVYIHHHQYFTPNLDTFLPKEISPQLRLLMLRGLAYQKTLSKKQRLQVTIQDCQAGYKFIPGSSPDRSSRIIPLSCLLNRSLSL